MWRALRRTRAHEQIVMVAEEGVAGMEGVMEVVEEGELAVMDARLWKTLTRTRKIFSAHVYSKERPCCRVFSVSKWKVMFSRGSRAFVPR